MLDSVEVVITQYIFPCGHLEEDMTEDEVLENLLDGTDRVWNAATQAVAAGATRFVYFLMSRSSGGSGWWPPYIKHFADASRRAVSGSLAEGKLIIL